MVYGAKHTKSNRDQTTEYQRSKNEPLGYWTGDGQHQSKTGGDEDARKLRIYSHEAHRTGMSAGLAILHVLIISLRHKQ